MSIDYEIPLIEQILIQWQPVIGPDYDGYKNHVTRMASFCLSLRKCSEEEKKKIAIAACFHDIGIWTDKTVDYIQPSIPPAME